MVLHRIPPSRAAAPYARFPRVAVKKVRKRKPPAGRRCSTGRSRVRNPVEIRDGRATVSGEPLEITATGGKLSSMPATIRESGY
jgi:hypothetical protein